MSTQQQNGPAGGEPIGADGGGGNPEDVRLQRLQALFPKLPTAVLSTVLLSFDFHAGKAIGYLKSESGSVDPLGNLPGSTEANAKTTEAEAPSLNDLANHTTPWCVRTRAGCIVCHAGKVVTSAIQRFLQRLHGRQSNCVLAVELNRVATVKFLVEVLGVNPNFAERNACENRGASPLLLAVEFGSAEVLECLTSYRGVDVTFRDKSNCTALLCAARIGSERMVANLANTYADTLRSAEEIIVRQVGWFVIACH